MPYIEGFVASSKTYYEHPKMSNSRATSAICSQRVLKILIGQITKTEENYCILFYSRRQVGNIYVY